MLFPAGHIFFFPSSVFLFFFIPVGIMEIFPAPSSRFGESGRKEMKRKRHEIDKRPDGRARTVGGGASSVAGGTAAYLHVAVSLETLTEAIFGPITIHVSFLSLQFYHRIYIYVYVHEQQDEGATRKK